ncbi:hypothetical protein CR513_59980, partial [Mucuna pruriens]
MYEKVCDLVVFPMEKTSKASREASDCKSPSWPRKALPTHYSSHPRPKGKKATLRICQANGDLDDDDKSPTSSSVNCIYGIYALTEEKNFYILTEYKQK